MAECKDSVRPKVLDADELIDEIIAKKGPHKYTDGLSEDNWEKELEQIPLFMTQPPTEVDPEKAPGIAALQALKYQTDTPHGRATAYKDEGNEKFRLKKYKAAVLEYTAAIKEKTDDQMLNAVLYTNRSAANFHIGNYRSSLNDATQAKTIKPDHIKALLRGALACQQLQRHGEAIEWCDEGLKVDPENKKLKDIRVKAIKEKKRRERDERKQLALDKSKEKEDQLLTEAIKLQGVVLAGGQRSQEVSLNGAHPSGGCVHLNEAGQLVWPVLFLYPEFGQTDYIEAFNETDRICDHLDVMFGGETPPWDRDRLYKPHSIKVYFEDVNDKLVEVSVQSTLNNVLKTNGYCVKCRTPSLILMSADSAFLKQYITKRT